MKIKHFLRKEYEFQKPNLIIFIRDLDTLLIDRKQLNFRKKYFTEYNAIVDKKGIFLLNVFEIEALILADNTKIFKRLNFEKLMKCDYFNNFIQNFNERILN